MQVDTFGFFYKMNASWIEAAHMNRRTDSGPYAPRLLPRHHANPFQPSPGGRPPKFAGRKKEMDLLDGVIAPMKKEEPTSSEPILFYGPRGFGKTCLLMEAGKKHKEDVWDVPKSRRFLGRILRRPAREKRHFRVVRASAGKDLDSVKGLIRVVMRNRPQGNLIKKVTGGRLGDAHRPDEVSVGFKGFFSSRYDMRKPPSIDEATELLISRCRYEPTIMLVDEAHVIKPKVAKALFNLEQDVRRDAPFLLVMGGTPGMIPHFGKVDASFVNRSLHMPLQRLSRDEARDALVEPFERHGIKVDPGIADSVVDESECFPFFVQMWGRYLWDSVKFRNEYSVDSRDMKAASESVADARFLYYEDMYNVIAADQEFRHAAYALACALKTAWAGKGHMDKDDGERVVRAELAKFHGDKEKLNNRAHKMMQKIVATDFVWQPHDHLVPAIPTFISHILKRGIIHDHDPVPDPQRGSGDRGDQDH